MTKPLDAIASELETMTTWAGHEFPDAVDRLARKYKLTEDQVHRVVEEYDAR